MYFDPSLSPRIRTSEPVFDEVAFLAAPHTSGHELRRLRYRFKVAAPELAALVGLDLDALMRYERGEAVLNEDQMTSLLNTFHELAMMMPPRMNADGIEVRKEIFHRPRERWFDDA